MFDVGRWVLDVLSSDVMRLAALPASDFDLAATLECGQVFHWRRSGAGFEGIIGDVPLFVEQRGDCLLVPAGTEELARHYFALDHPLAEICATFPDDPAMNAAREFCRGLRIVRQPPWECLATFITSALKQVAHIAQISHTLRARFGDRIEWQGRTFFSYPTAATSRRVQRSGSPRLRARLSREESARCCTDGRRR